jgi:hypothetical protein
MNYRRKSHFRRSDTSRRQEVRELLAEQAAERAAVAAERAAEARRRDSKRYQGERLLYAAFCNRPCRVGLNSGCCRGLQKMRSTCDRRERFRY